MDDFATLQMPLMVIHHDTIVWDNDALVPAAVEGMLLVTTRRFFCYSHPRPSNYFYVAIEHLLWHIQRPDAMYCGVMPAKINKILSTRVCKMTYCVATTLIVPNSFKHSR